MADFLSAKVALSNAAYSYDVEYSYGVPAGMRAALKPGARVLIPFGRGNRKRIGFVTDVTVMPEENPDLKPVLQLIDQTPPVGEELLRLVFWLKENTLCTFYEAYKTVLPSGFAYRFTQHYELVNAHVTDLTEEEAQAVAFLKTADTAEAESFLDVRANPSRKRLVEALIEKGVIEEIDSLRRRLGDNTIKMVRLSDGWMTGEVQKKLTPKQKLIVTLLEDCSTASVKEVAYMTGATGAIVKNLVKAQVLTQYEYEAPPPEEECPAQPAPELTLTAEQERAFNGIKALLDAGKPAGALLFGVTGSGKTAVFIHLIAYTLSLGKSVLMLVPEIALTPQTVQSFRCAFGKGVAVVHSGLSLRQRADEFKRIQSGAARIVIGTRSAVFAPAENIGLIVMDEEGEHTYKSEASPRYHARDAAAVRCGYHNAVLLMASATPSVETFHWAQKGRYHLFELKERYAGARLPEVVTVDMQAEAEAGNTGLFSQPLIDAMHETLRNGEQVILLLNRRGFSTYVSCSDCKTQALCPNCNILMTLHRRNSRLMCHYCGFSRDYDGKCASCGSTNLRVSGVGTQRVEDELDRLFPKTRVLRMDADTTGSRFAYEKNFADFEAGAYDIMLGTQMIAKGLNFPNVTLVGVLTLDKALFSGDYKAYERTFSLITQVVGRGGRGQKPGKAFLQTFVPEHYVIALAAQQDYPGFFESEAALRRTLLFPPFCDICVVGFSGLTEAESKAASQAFVELMRIYIAESGLKIPLRVLGPAPYTLEKINNRYRYRIIIKCKNTPEFRLMLSTLLMQSARDKAFSGVRVFADINGDIGL
ncbi:MAG: primosomal protein N' [Oscillospiraceae bacterium]